MPSPALTKLITSGMSVPAQLLAQVGLGYLGASVSYLFYPNHSSRSASNRHYLNEKGVWVSDHSDLDGTIDASGIYTPPSRLELNADWSSVVAQAWVGASASRAYNLPLTRNSDIVPSAGYLSTHTGHLSYSATGKEQWMNGHWKQRVRQSGTITRIQCVLANVSELRTLRFQFWRKNGSTYDLVSETADISSGVVNGVNVWTISVPVEIGDYIGVRFTCVGADDFCEYKGVVGAKLYYTVGDPLTTPANWEAESFSAAGHLFTASSQAPLIVSIGDSITASLDGLISATAPSDLTGGYLPKLKLLDSRFVYQNMGIGSETTTQIEARFAADCVALKPRYVIIQGGGNDIAGGGSESTFITKMTSMLDRCVAASIIPIVIGITPWNGSTANMQTRDAWKASLRTLLNTYATAIYVEPDNSIGQFRAGGDAGNLWDLQTAYDSGDHVHLNAAGNAVLAESIYNAIFAYVKPEVANKALFLFDRTLTAAEIAALETLHTKL